MPDQYPQLPEPEEVEVEPHYPLGVAGRMAQAFINSPLSPLLLVAMLFMGIMGLLFTPRQEDPQISVPMVDIFIQYPGASAKQVASLAINPLQRIMSEIPAVEHVYSAAERGQGMVTVQFEVGEQLEHSIFKVYDKLQSNMDKIPPGVSMPLVKPKGIDDVPVVTITLWSKEVNDGALRSLALDVMQSLKEVENTGQSFIVGGRSEQVRVEVHPQNLLSYNISLGQIAQVIQTANSEKNAGFIEYNDTYFTVYTGGFLRTARDIQDLVVGNIGDKPIYVRDLADVTQGYEDTQQTVRFFSGPSYNYENQDKTAPPTHIEGEAAITIAIAKKIGTNGVTVAKAIREHVQSLKERLIPTNVHVELTRDYGQTAKDKVDELIIKLFVATGLVMVLIVIFFRHIVSRPFWWLPPLPGITPATVVLIVIPTVILITVFSAWVMGYTIDRVSLFALIFSIGILVDDAIVVIENIYRRWLLKGETDTATAVDAVREVGNPTILATFTVVAALLPMGFVSGMMGPYMEPIPALGSAAMIFSLFAAFIFTPWLAMRFRPSIESLQKAEVTEHRFNIWAEGFFRKILPPLINNRTLGYSFLFGLIGAFFAACLMFYTTAVQVKMLPLDNKPEFDVFINMPEGTPLPVTENITYQIAEKIRTIKEVTGLQAYVGTSQPFDFNGMVRHYYLRSKPWYADIHVQLRDKRARPRSSHEIAVEARLMIKKLLEDQKSPAKIAVVEMPPGPPVLQSVVAEVYGPDEETRRSVAKKLTEAFEAAEILDDVDNYITKPYKVWKFEIDVQKASKNGISVDDINQQLAMAMGNFKVGDVKKETVLEPTYIILQVPLGERSPPSRLNDLPVPNQMGNMVPLSELGRFTEMTEDYTIFQKDLRPVEFVVGESVGIYLGNNKYRLSAPVYGMFEVESLLAEQNYYTPDNIPLHSGHYINRPETDAHSGFEWTGEWTVTYETFRDMGLAFGVALVLIYILVVWEFGNFIVPAVIMAPIPLTLLGIIPGHWLWNVIRGGGGEFTATSMIGWIALAGIIVRNSILLVDYSIHEVQKGTNIQDAVILACKTRTRPIMITAFALVFGSFVILTDPIFEGMAISLMAGVVVSTILTLVVIPLGCISIGPHRLCATGLGEEDSYLSCEISPSGTSQEPPPAPPPTTPLWLRIWGGMISLIMWIVQIVTILFYIIRAPFMLLSTVFQRPAAPPPANTSPLPTTAVPSATSEPVTEPVEVAPNEVELPPAIKPKETPSAPKKPSPEVAIREETPQKAIVNTATKEIVEETIVQEEVETKLVETAAKAGKKPPKKPKKGGGLRGIRLKSDLHTDDEDKSEEEDKK